MANSLWSSSNSHIYERYTEEISRKYKAGVSSVDFTNPETTTMINEWVSEKTNNMIPKLLSGELDEDTLLVILNAVYFKGFWEEEFKQERTYKRDFQVSETEKKPTDFMHAFKKFSFARGKSQDSSYNMMRYKDSNIGFVTYLPTKGDCPLETVDLDVVTKMDTAENYTDVNFAMPKFEISSKYSLKKVL